MKTEINRERRKRTGSAGIHNSEARSPKAAPVTFRIAGYISAGAAAAIFLPVLGYAFFNNENLIRESAESRIQLMLFAFGWLLIMLTVVLCAAWILLTFMKTFAEVICTMFDGERKIDMRDSSWLKMLSILIFILLTAYILLPGDRLNGLAVLFGQAGGLTAPLLMLGLLLTGYMGIHIIYKLLEAFVNKESGLKKYVDKIAHMLMNMGGELILCLLRFLRFVPEFLGWGYDLLRTEEWDIMNSETEEEME